MQEKAEGLNVKQEDTYNIVERSLWDFLQQIEVAVKQGYTLSDENKHFPQSHISLYTVTLVKEDEPESMVEKFNMPTEYVVEVEVDTVVVENTTEVVKKADGRKKVVK